MGKRKNVRKSVRTYPTPTERGFRSQSEQRVAEALESLGCSYEYETVKVPYVKPAERKHYLIDFVLSNGIAIEVKGEFDSTDRKKHLLVKEQYPNLDLRFVFDRPTAKLSKRSKTSYGEWCEQHGFPYAKQKIPQKWLNESVNRRSLQAIEEIKNNQKYKGGKNVWDDTKGNDS